MLHAHLPWGHLADEDDAAAQWLLEACVDCYQPLLEALERVEAERVPYRLTLSLSPPLAAMWESPVLPERLARFVEAEKRAYEKAPATHAAAAKFHLDRLAKPRRNLLDGFRKLKNVELICSTATHGFLPLLTTVPQIARAQVRIAAAVTKPPGMWLAECGYAEGADAWLLESGVRYCFVDSHAVAKASHQHHRAVRTPAGLFAFARDPQASEQVWSRDLGYPGDRAYLDFHHRLEGCRVLRVPGDAPWDPARAREKAIEHAKHFVAQRAKTDAEVIVAPYDAELFGHWWFEGPDFLEAVIREGGASMVTATDHLAQYPAAETIELPVSSWGRDGYAAVWLDEKNAWMWPHLHRAAEELLTLEPTHLRAWTQAVRELLLAQSSDWPFLIEAGTNAGYAKQRFEDHLLAFRALAAQLKSGAIDEASLQRREAANNLFGAIDARVYGSGPWPPR